MTALRPACGQTSRALAPRGRGRSRSRGGGAGSSGARSRQQDARHQWRSPAQVRLALPRPRTPGHQHCLCRLRWPCLWDWDWGILGRQRGPRPEPDSAARCRHPRTPLIPRRALDRLRPLPPAQPPPPPGAVASAAERCVQAGQQRAARLRTQLWADLARQAAASGHHRLVLEAAPRVAAQAWQAQPAGDREMVMLQVREGSGGVSPAGCWTVKVLPPLRPLPPRRLGGFEFAFDVCTLPPRSGRRFGVPKGFL